MTALLETHIRVRTPLEIARSLHHRVTSWAEPAHTAQAAAEILSEELGRPAVSVFRCGPGGDHLLLGSAPRGDKRVPQGGRRRGERRLLDAAVANGAPQRAINFYVEPDFVRSLPGETRSALAVPVALRDEVLGVVYLEYATPQAPTAGDEEVAALVASHLAIAWSLPDADSLAGGGDASSERRLREAAALAGITSTLARTEDLSGVRERVVGAVRELTGCEGAILLLKHPSRQMLEVAATAGSPAVATGSLVPIDGTLAGEVCRSGDAIEARGAAGEPILAAGLLSTPPRSALLVPVGSAGANGGVLIALNAPAATGFDPEDARLLQAFADQAGAVEGMRTIPKLRQRISDASLIAEVGRAMTGTLGLDDVLALVVRAAEMLVSGRFAAVALLSDERTSLILAAGSGSLRGREGTVLTAREDVMGLVAIGGESLVVDSLAGSEHGWSLGDPFGPAVVVPLESRGQIRGVLLAGRQPGGEPLTDSDLDALRKLAAYSAIAIDNARLYREQTDLSRALTQQAKELEKAYADLHSSQERLLVSEKMAALGRVTAGIAHEINSPLGSILNCLQLATTYAQEYRESAVDPEVTPDDHVGIATDLIEALGLAEEATRRVAQFVRTIKGQTRMDEERVTPFDPAEETDGTLLLLQHELSHGRNSVVADLERGLRVRGDASKFAVIVQNLVSNAVDAYEGGEGVVHVRLRRRENGAVLEVEDAGAGIPEEIRQRIYDYLFTTKDVGRGTGLGLSLVHSIVTSHFRGTIDYRSEVGVGTTFIVTIPLLPEG